MPAPLSLDIRQIIIESLECGMTHGEIAEDLSISRSAVTGINRHHKIHGHIFPIRPPGNKPTFTEEDCIIIKDIVKQDPDLTLSDYAEAIFKKTDKPLMSVPTVFRVLRKLDLRRKKKSKYAEERDREDVKKKGRLYRCER